MLDLIILTLIVGGAVVGWTLVTEDTSASRRVVQVNYHPDYPPDY